MSQTPEAPAGPVRPALARNAGIDLVRVIGLVAVVGGHVFSSSPIAREFTYSWHMPLFFLLTGYLWNERRTLGGEWRTRLRTLMLPYLAWVVILAALYAGFGLLLGSFDPKRLIGGLIGGGGAGAPFVTLWFVSTLFFVALLYRLIARLPMWAQWGVALLGVAAGALAPRPLSHVPLGFGIALTCVVYVVAGHAFRTVRARVDAPLPVGLVLLSVCAACVALKVAKPLDLKHLNLGTPVVSVAIAIGISIAVILIVERIMQDAPGWLGRAATVLALASLTVVFLHPALMWLFPAPHELRWARFLLVLVVPWVLGVVVAYTPAATWLNGGKTRLTRTRRTGLPATT
ncbi:MAG: acyltransferase family protein [Amnibacterium sp.]